MPFESLKSSLVLNQVEFIYPTDGNTKEIPHSNWFEQAGTWMGGCSPWLFALVFLSSSATNLKMATPAGTI
jgi:hypothetical protein